MIRRFSLTGFVVVGVAAFAISTSSASAGLLSISGVTGSSGGDHYGNGMASLTNGSGIDASVDATDPSTWTMSGNSYKDEWMPWYFSDNGSSPPKAHATTGSNGKIAWASFDLGSSQALGTLWLFNSNYSAGAAGVQTFNLYTADSPTVALPAEPAKNTYASTGLSPQGDYNFASGGWTKFNTSGVLTLDKSVSNTTGIGSYDLSGITARYVAIEILSNYGDTYNGGRSGLDEVAITTGAAAPEPASLALAVAGGGLLLVSRRRQKV